MFDFFFSCGKRRENQKEIEEMSLTEKNTAAWRKIRIKTRSGRRSCGGRDAGGTGRLLQCCATLIYVYS